MAYLNEFPHTEASKLNLDWILEQYSTFNQRLAEIVQHFDDSVAEMEGDIEQFKGDYEHAFEEYKSQVTQLIEDFKTQIQQESYNVERTLETITNNMTEYVGEHMSEWQVNACRLTVPVTDSYGTGVIPDVLASEHDIVILDCFYAYRDNDNILWKFIQKMDVVTVYIDTDNHYHINVVPQIKNATFYVHYMIV